MYILYAFAVWVACIKGVCRRAGQTHVITEGRVSSPGTPTSASAKKSGPITASSVKSVGATVATERHQQDNVILRADPFCPVMILNARTSFFFSGGWGGRER